MKVIRMGIRMSKENCETVRRFIEEAFNAGNTKILEEIIDESHVSHLPNGDHYGPDGVRIDIACFRAAFPDLALSIEDMVDGGDTVVYRFVAKGTHGGPFLGVPATGRKVTVDGIGIDRFSNGRTVERWIQYDSAGLLQQLGVLPGLAAVAD
jgi:steroid delta-isomerase-like uncharacterized protein